MQILLVIVLIFSSLLSVSLVPGKDTLVDQGVFWDLSGNFTGDRTAIFEGKQVYAPDSIFLAQSTGSNQVLGVTSSEERWVEVDLSEQTLRAWEGDNLFLESLVSTGLYFSPTPTGEFRIWTKFKATKMSGGQGRNYYYLPNVPYVMFFENADVPGFKGYGLHGTYWHNDFGRPKSHGCVNLPTPIAEKLYYWTTPVLGEDDRSQRASTDNLGTRIVIHD